MKLRTVLKIGACILLISSEMLIRHTLSALGLDERLDAAVTDGFYFFGKFLSIAGMIWGISIGASLRRRNDQRDE